MTYEQTLIISISVSKTNFFSSARLWNYLYCGDAVSQVEEALDHIHVGKQVPPHSFNHHHLIESQCAEYNGMLKKWDSLFDYFELIVFKETNDCFTF